MDSRSIGCYTAYRPREISTHRLLYSRPIDAVFSLSSTTTATDSERADPGIGAKFKTSAITTHGTLDLDFVRAPGHSILLDARTSGRATNIKLPDTYERKFSLGTTLEKTKGPCR